MASRESRLKEVRERLRVLGEEEGRLQGKRGICSVCGEDVQYYSALMKICTPCNTKRRAEKAQVKGREAYGHLLGQKVVALFVSSWDDDLHALELADGHIIEVEVSWEGDGSLDVRKRQGQGTGMSPSEYAEVREGS